MKERQILFKAQMVRAILEGRKTQTRRVVKPQPRIDEMGNFCWNGWNFGQGFGGPHIQSIASPIPSSKTKRVHCPYGKPGDRLWVRETFKAIASGDVKNGYGKVRYGFAYQADGATIWNERPTIIHDLTGQPPSGPMQFKPVPWKPSIHMPRRASRILLEVTGVRVERLNDISEADAKAEGAMFHDGRGIGHSGWRHDYKDVHANARSSYARLWQEINGPRLWEANPWVWVIEFKRVNQ